MQRSGDVLANHRLDAPHSGVTALAQGRKRRATGRAGQAERYAPMIAVQRNQTSRTM